MCAATTPYLATIPSHLLAHTPAPLSAPCPLAAAGRCDLRMALYTEIWPDANVANTTDIGLYPVNAMRNRALQMVDTEVSLGISMACSTCSLNCQHVELQ